MRVVLIGATGQLGSDLARSFAQEELTCLNHQELEVCDHPRVRDVLTSVGPDLVINTSAFHKVDLCEEQVQKSFAVNAFAVKNLAEVCAELNCALVHFSSDYVFDGEKGSPYAEEDRPGPVNVYGASKLTGEYFVQMACPQHLLVRTSGLFGLAGASGKGGNFVETMVRLGREREVVRVVNDQTLSPTLTQDLAGMVYELVSTGAYGLYHINNSGYCSWYELACRIFESMQLPARLEPTTSQEFGAKARRPRFSVLESAGLARLNLPSLRPWEEAVKEYLALRKGASSGV